VLILCGEKVPLIERLPPIFTLPVVDNPFKFVCALTNKSFPMFTFPSKIDCPFVVILPITSKLFLAIISLSAIISPFTKTSPDSALTINLLFPNTKSPATFKADNKEVNPFTSKVFNTAFPLTFNTPLIVPSELTSNFFTAILFNLLSPLTVNLSIIVAEFSLAKLPFKLVISPEEADNLDNLPVLSILKISVPFSFIAEIIFP